IIMNYKITYLILTTFLLLIFPSCENDSKPDPTLDYCTQFNNMEEKCLDNSCFYNDTEIHFSVFKGYFHNSQCIGYQPGNFCISPAINCQGNVDTNKYSLTSEGTPYIAFEGNDCDRYPEEDWNIQAPECSVQEEICNQKSTRVECLDNFCFWVQAKKAVINENICTGWEPETTNMCIGDTFLKQFGSEIGTSVVYKPTEDGTILIDIKEFEHNNKVGGFLTGNQATDFEGNEVNYDLNKIYIRNPLYKKWYPCNPETEQNPICNCPEQ
ncbi:MAG: hypothetical protein PF689_06325, partial [Deltaproteobacteria bacterium]|nr:hypothetical protein [Deltaproteobacteria bacterium]